jgi:hypothetical protein
MNGSKQIAPAHADSEMAQIIARETGAPLELATRIFKEELRNLTRGARITQFVNVLAGRRARLKLQHHRDRRAAM